VTHPGDATGQTEGARRQTIAVPNGLISKAGGGFELADPPPALEGQRRKLRENSYKALVAGETKRGKSAFVNAPIVTPAGGSSGLRRNAEGCEGPA